MRVSANVPRAWKSVRALTLDRVTSGLQRGPPILEKSSVIPIPKASDHQNPSNYRPISLLPILSKMLEPHFHTLISTHLVNNYPLSNHQSGNQLKLLFSYHLCLVYAPRGWQGHLRRIFWFTQGIWVCPHRALMSKLHSLDLILLFSTGYAHIWQIGSRGWWGRDIRISTCPFRSSTGLCTRPLLFLIYIDDVMSASLPTGSKLTLYAHDMLLYMPIDKAEDYIVLQQWTILNSWVWQLLDTKLHQMQDMVISRKKDHIFHPDLYLGEDLMEKVECFKYLGLIVSSDLSWMQHVNSICSKAKRLLGLLYRRFYHHTSPQALLEMYQTLVKPHTEYASSVWDPHLQKDKNALEDIQKFATRMCAKQWDFV